MTSRDFAYWLQGFFEITESDVVTEHQVAMIKKHLNLVFVHEIDPSFGDDKHQEKLDAIHNQFTPINIRTEEDAIAKFGPKPGPKYKFNMHGWYDPKLGIPKC